MKNNIGLWIDHRKAIIVQINGDLDEIHTITSNMEKHIRHSGGRPDDIQDNKFNNHLNEYYDKVKSFLRDANSILLFGPGEAKVELSVRLKGDTLGDRIADIEVEDKMTEGQIAAKVREYFKTSTKVMSHT